MVEAGKASPLSVLVTRASREDAADILELQRLAYQSEARLYDDWSLPPLTQSLQSLEEEIRRSTVLKALLGARLMQEIERAFPQAARFQLFTGSRSIGNIRLYHRLGYRRSHEKAQSPAITLVFMEKRGREQAT